MPPSPTVGGPVAGSGRAESKLKLLGCRAARGAASRQPLHPPIAILSRARLAIPSCYPQGASELTNRGRSFSAQRPRAYWQSISRQTLGQRVMFYGRDGSNNRPYMFP
eukprot:11865770-Heterocapsa_arctica.AAC.1